MAYPLAGSGVGTPPVGAIYPTGNTNPSPAYSGTFIPEIWSGKLIEKFYASTVLAAISNTDYEGEIKNQGDKVKIRTKPTISIKNYGANQLLEIDRPASNILEFPIDRGKYFNLILDDVMEVQSDLNMMNMWSDDAAQQFKIVVDREVLLDLMGDAAPDNMGATAGIISKSVNLGTTGAGALTVVARNAVAPQVEITDLIVNMGLVLDEQNVPEQGRWIVLPAIFGAMIKKSELRDAALTGDATSILRNGRLGMVDRFTIYISNLLPHSVTGNLVSGLAAGEWAIYAGTQHALTFASQINKVETLRSEMTFGQLLRGLQVFGWKVLDGTALVQAIVKAG